MLAKRTFRQQTASNKLMRMPGLRRVKVLLVWTCLSGIATLALRFSSDSGRAQGNQNQNANVSAPQSTEETWSKVKPDKLIKIIQEQQRKYVKESYGEGVGENFSDQDLKDFIAADIPGKMAGELRKNKDFLDVVLAIKHMPMKEQPKLAKRAVNTFRPTWGEFGSIDRRAQTAAGQQADKRIAIAVFNRVGELLKLSDDEIKKLSLE